MSDHGVNMATSPKPFRANGRDEALLGTVASPPREPSTIFDPLYDDNQSHSGSTNQHTIDELASRIRSLELNAFGARHSQPSRAFGKQHSLPTDPISGGRSELLEFIERDRERAIANGRSNGCDDQEWKLEVKRWKRVPNRNGSVDLHDAGQKIEDIRRKEQEIRAGGFVLSAYDDYDLDGKKLNTFLQIHSGPLLDVLRKVITFFPGYAPFKHMLTLSSMKNCGSTMLRDFLLNCCETTDTITRQGRIRYPERQG